MQKLFDLSKQFDNGLCTALEYRNALVLALCEIESEDDIVQIMHALTGQLAPEHYPTES